ncbi:DUF4012 domain-containing protein [Candidatus Gracilibacteria bacterium]|nr:DUF4012 domain-containing protein [Candidatus Gracilibacteria bacterium]
MSQKITDLSKKLKSTIDLSDAINKSIKISKGKKIRDLQTNLKHLRMRRKRVIKFSRLSNQQIDPVSEIQRKTINLNNAKKTPIFKKQLRKTKQTFQNTSKKFHFNPNFHFIKKFQNFLPDFNFPKFQKLQNFKFFSNQNILKKILFAFVFVIFIGLLDKILLETTLRNGYQNLLDIRQSGTNIQTIEKKISSAQRNLFFADIFYFPVSFLNNQQVQNIGHLIDGGQEVTGLLKNSIGVYKTANNLISKNKLENINFIAFLDEIEKNKDKIKKHLYNGILQYNQIKNLPQPELNQKLENGKNLMFSAHNFFDIIYDNYEVLKNIFGKQGTRTYAIAFQNNDEIRPSGGFTGSYGILTLENGAIKKFEKKDVYALEWEINKNYKQKIPAPKGLDKITKTFGLRDANYYPEMKDSAHQIQTFLKMMNLNIDGVIFMNQNSIKELLDVVGGVDSYKLGYFIDSKNFSEIISTLTEAEVTRQGKNSTPKQGLFNFAGEFYAKLLAEKRYVDYLNILIKDIQKRDIVVYSFHPQENSLLWKLGVNGTLDYNKYVDFNYPVYTSIGGNKSDRYIRYDYEKQIQKLDSCTYQTNLKIYNEHHFAKEDEIRLDNFLKKYEQTGKPKEDIKNIQGKGENKAFLRVLIPLNAVVQAQRGQIVVTKKDYKIVELFTKTPAGKKSNYSITYNIFNPKCKEYTYKFYKQPGIGKYDISFLEDNIFTDYKNIKTDFVLRR